MYLLATLLLLKHLGNHAPKLALEQQVHSFKNARWLKTSCSDDSLLEAILRDDDEYLLPSVSHQNKGVAIIGED